MNFADSAFIIIPTAVSVLLFLSGLLILAFIFLIEQEQAQLAQIRKENLRLSLLNNEWNSNKFNTDPDWFYVSSHIRELDNSRRLSS